MKRYPTILAAFGMTAVLNTPVAVASAAHEQHADHAATQTAEFGPDEGLVRKVDKEQGKLTIKHGPLTSVDMPAMTMVFRVKDAAMLDQVSAGDRVRLQVEKINGVFTVTGLVKS